MQNFMVGTAMQPNVTIIVANCYCKMSTFTIIGAKYGAQLSDDDNLSKHPKKHGKRLHCR